MRPVLRVMLVDDHGFVRSAIRQALTAPDIEVVGEAPSAEEALRIAPELRPDVVLIDLNLPKVDGLRVIAHLRNHPLCAATPVVVVTSSDAPRDRERATGLGVARYFRKPSELDEFMHLGAIVKDALAMK